ncbi:MAG: secretin N-terminal domain-containing protein [Candidatus Sericytochromatia bacterium]|nr:secretin N-terminal domain-containing protein [Candidatus Sericytochromatia bacterium]
MKARSRALRSLLAACVLASAWSTAAPAWAQDATERNGAVKDQLINFKDIPALIKNPTFITLKFDNADVREVLRLIAQRGGMNLIIDESVKGRFTIDVRAVPLDEFFGIVLRTNGLAARRVGTSLLIANEEQLRAKIDSSQAATFRLNNAKATDVMRILMGVLEQKSQGKVKVVADERTNSLVVSGTGEDLTKIRNAIRAIDVPAPQVVIEVKLVEVTRGALKRLGGEFGFGGSKFGFSSNVSDINVTANGQPSAGIPPSGSGGTTVTFSSLGNVTSNLNARITALVNRGEAQVLANPRVATQDNVQAEIAIVNRFPIVSTTFVGAAGGAANATQQVQFQDIGERLTITPRIDTNGFVTMDIQPNISVRGKDVIVNGNPVPEINERRLKTTMRVADGETVVIGGLIRRNTTNSLTKTPLLGDLPFIGFLFRQESNSNDETEVIVMVTPHIKSGERLMD